MASPLSLPSISDDDDEVLINDRHCSVIIDKLLHAKRVPLESERQALEERIHPEYVEKIRQADTQFKIRLRQIQMIEEKEKEFINSDYEAELRALQQYHAKRIDELTISEEFFHGQEPLHDNQTDGPDFGHSTSGGSEVELNFVGTSGTAHQGIASKKFLRRRHNETVYSVPGAIVVSESGKIRGVSALLTDAGMVTKRRTKKAGSPGVGDANGRQILAGHGGAATAAGLSVAHLLSDSDIAEDVHHLLTNSELPHGQRSGLDGFASGGLGAEEASGGRGGLLTGPGFSSGGEMFDEDNAGGTIQLRHHRHVIIEQNKLVLDRKTFNRFQNVFIYLRSESGRLPATICSISEGRYVEFRSGISGDTRQFTATKDDLESGRVFVRKRY